MSAGLQAIKVSHRNLDRQEAAKQLVNRAAAHLMCGQPVEALLDCEQALEVRVLLAAAALAVTAGLAMLRRHDLIASSQCGLPARHCDVSARR